MKRYSLLGTAIVSVHGVIAIVHGLAHERLLIELSFPQKIFILLVITLAPLLAVILMWTRAFTIGSGLLVFSMVGSLIFGITYHFVIPSPDHVMHLRAGAWRIPFQLTAVFLALTEMLGSWVGISALWHKN
jgi:hypothetical protein